MRIDLRPESTSGEAAGFGVGKTFAVRCLGAVRIPLLSVLLGVVATVAWPAPDTPRMASILPTLVFRFGQHVGNWEGKPRLTIGVYEQPFSTAYLDAFVKTLGERATLVEIDPDSPLEVDILFIAGNVSENAARDMVKRSAARPILLVSDRPGFLDDGGMIQLNARRDGVPEFVISQKAALAAKLSLNAQLLVNAKEVRR